MSPYNDVDINFIRNPNETIIGAMTDYLVYIAPMDVQRRLSRIGDYEVWYIAMGVARVLERYGEQL